MISASEYFQNFLNYLAMKPNLTRILTPIAKFFGFGCKFARKSTWISTGFVFFVLLAHFYANFLMPIWYGNADVRIHGTVAAQYQPIVDIFRNNFMSGLDREGAHLVVLERGRVVVDLWAGFADRANGKKWTHHTQSILFSISKSLSALCIAKLVDTGHLRWDDRVAKFWPEFAANGKANTTIDHVLMHQSALPYIDEPISLWDVRNRTSLHAKLARARPAWEPGTATGYHAVTQGFLIDAIVERVDPKRRSLQQFFDEEIAQAYDVDISIGAKAGRAHRIVQFALPDAWEIARFVIMEPRLVFAYLLMELQSSESPLHRMKRNTDWLHVDTIAGFFNDARIRRLPLGSLTGVAEARALARLFALMLEGRLFRERATRAALLQPRIHNWHWERTVLYPIMKGRGFFYEYHPLDKEKFVFGHPGYGCQTLHLDAERDLVLVYLSNTLKPASSVLCLPYQRLLRGVYRILADKQHNQNPP